jgi:hypothetical protein
VTQRNSDELVERRTAYSGAGNNTMVAFWDFTCDDQKELGAMLEFFSRRAGHKITIEDLVVGWIAFVDKVQSGHEFLACDYEEGLGLRGMLEELVECLSEPGRQELVRVLLRPDRLFLSLTLPVNGALSRAWWKRYPQSLVQELNDGEISVSDVGLRSGSHLAQTL